MFSHWIFYSVNQINSQDEQNLWFILVDLLFLFSLLAQACRLLNSYVKTMAIPKQFLVILTFYLDLVRNNQ